MGEGRIPCKKVLRLPTHRLCLKKWVRKFSVLIETCVHVSDPRKKSSHRCYLAANQLRSFSKQFLPDFISCKELPLQKFETFAGEEIEVKKLVDAASKEAVDKGKTAAGAISAVDAVLEQIKKKPKSSVLDKSKKDWGEFKDDNIGMEDELDAYKKSSNQYLDKVSFLQRTDYRELERERDARLAVQAKRKVDMRDD